MSWMTKEGSSLASGQSPLDSWLSELARREVAPRRHDATDATECACVVDDRGASGATTKRATIRWAGRAVGKPLGERGVYRFEGFG
jgi:hypothetical protein